MITKKLLIITEGGKKIGFGHITRTISLVTKFNLLGYSIHFVINSDTSLDNVIKPYSYEIYNWLSEPKKLENTIKESQLILLDSMKIPNKQIKQLETFNVPIIFIDDEKQRNILDYGFVIDWTILKDSSTSFFPRKKEVTYFLGSLFTPLRKEFLSSPRIKIKKEIKSIFISFGGSDVRNLSPKILKFLNEKYPLLEKNVVIGPGFNNIKEIQEFADNTSNLFYNLNSLEMIKCMRTSDIAISAGGQTLYELARISIPTIGILLVDNAKDDTFGWNKVGFLDYIGEYDDLNLLNNLEQSMKEIQSYEKRIEMYRSVEKYVNFENENILVQKIIEVLDDII
jgi:spore coat polysaccharide biosynthesis predicted glycosyltransferase SpsG